MPCPLTVRAIMHRGPAEFPTASCARKRLPKSLPSLATATAKPNDFHLSTIGSRLRIFLVYPIPWTPFKSTITVNADSFCWLANNTASQVDPSLQSPSDKTAKTLNDFPVKPHENAIPQARPKP